MFETGQPVKSHYPVRAAELELVVCYAGRRPPPLRCREQEGRAHNEQQCGDQPEQAERLRYRLLQLFEGRQVERFGVSHFGETHQVDQAVDHHDAAPSVQPRGPVSALELVEFPAAGDGQDATGCFVSRRLRLVHAMRLALAHLR
jgi:hypothetical protein